MRGSVVLHQEIVMSAARASTSMEVDGSFSPAGISFITPLSGNALQRRRRKVVSPRLKSPRTSLIGYGTKDLTKLGVFAVFFYSRQPAHLPSGHHANPRRRRVRNLDEQPPRPLLHAQKLGDISKGEARRASCINSPSGREGWWAKRVSVFRQQEDMVCR